MAPKNLKKKGLRFFKFGIVGGFGTIINTSILWMLTSFFGIYYLIASLIATETAIIFNYFGDNFFTFSDSKNNSSHYSKFVKFQIISLTTIVGTISILWFLTETFFNSAVTPIL